MTDNNENPLSVTDIEQAVESTNIEPYDSLEEFAIALAAVIARAEATDDDVLTRGTVASTLERWRSTMTGKVVLPIPLSPTEACQRRDEFDNHYGETAQVELPIDEKLIHDIDSQLTALRRLHGRDGGGDE